MSLETALTIPLLKLPLVQPIFTLCMSLLCQMELLCTLLAGHHLLNHTVPFQLMYLFITSARIKTIFYSWFYFEWAYPETPLHFGYIFAHLFLCYSPTDFYRTQVIVSLVAFPDSHRQDFDHISSMFFNTEV